MWKYEPATSEIEINGLHGTRVCALKDNPIFLAQLDLIKKRLPMVDKDTTALISKVILFGYVQNRVGNNIF